MRKLYCHSTSFQCIYLCFFAIVPVQTRSVTRIVPFPIANTVSSSIPCALVCSPRSFFLERLRLSPNSILFSFHRFFRPSRHCFSRQLLPKPSRPILSHFPSGAFPKGWMDSPSLKISAPLTSYYIRWRSLLWSCELQNINPKNNSTHNFFFSHAKIAPLPLLGELPDPPPPPMFVIRTPPLTPIRRNLVASHIRLGTHPPGADPRGGARAFPLGRG